MKTIYFTLTGCNHHFGMTVKLVKEPDKEWDKEAIRVDVEGLGAVGHVANSVYTVLGESYIAGRIYDLIGDSATESVMFILDRGVVCRLHERCFIAGH